MKFKTEIENTAYRLAMLGLQSERYQQDRDYKEAVDAVLNLTLLLDKNRWICCARPECENSVSDPSQACEDCVEYFTRPESRTVESDLLEDR